MARSNTVYLRTASGKTESFDQFRSRLRNLSTSENMRYAELKSLLMKEAQPLVSKARSEAYKGVEKKGSSMNGFFNLYKSIGKFASKKKDKCYVVVGVRSPRKRGAIYAISQLFGAGPGMGAQRPKKVGVGKSQGTQDSYRRKVGGKWVTVDPTYQIQPKDFIGKAVDSTSVLRSSQTLMQRHIQKRLKALLS